MAALLEINDLIKLYPIFAGGVLLKKHHMLKAIDDISFTIRKGECFGVAGESGSGKTTLVKLILLLEKITKGSISFAGKDINKLTPKETLWYRKKCSNRIPGCSKFFEPSHANQGHCRRTDQSPKPS